MLIDSIMGTIDHIYCDNTFHVITEQNHRRNTIVRPQGSQGCQKMRQDPLNMPVEVWCAKIAPKL